MVWYCIVSAAVVRTGVLPARATKLHRSCRRIPGGARTRSRRTSGPNEGRSSSAVVRRPSDRVSTAAELNDTTPARRAVASRRPCSTDHGATNRSLRAGMKHRRWTAGVGRCALPPTGNEPAARELRRSERAGVGRTTSPTVGTPFALLLIAIGPRFGQISRPRFPRADSYADARRGGFPRKMKIKEDIL